LRKSGRSRQILAQSLQIILHGHRNVPPPAAAVNAAQAPATVVADEGHSTWTMMFRDATKAERHIG
jgi:hypothetical protein